MNRVAALLLTGLVVTASATAQGPAAADPGAQMTVGRLHYDGGGDWYANPSSLPNLLNAIRSRTGLRVAQEERVVTLRDDDLWNLPYLYMTGHGNVRFSEEDLVILPVRERSKPWRQANRGGSSAMRVLACASALL